MNAMRNLEKLCVALTEDCPIVLLLGQDIWRDGTREDAVLEIAFRRFEEHSKIAPPYSSCISKYT